MSLSLLQEFGGSLLQGALSNVGLMGTWITQVNVRAGKQCHQPHLWGSMWGAGPEETRALKFQVRTATPYSNASTWFFFLDFFILIFLFPFEYLDDQLFPPRLLVETGNVLWATVYIWWLDARVIVINQYSMLSSAGKRRRRGSNLSTWRRSSWRSWGPPRCWWTAGESQRAGGVWRSAGDTTVPPQCPRPDENIARSWVAPPLPPSPQVL